MTAIDGAHFDALADDLERAIARLVGLIERRPEAWTHARHGKWTAGQHAEHVANALDLMYAPFVENKRKLEAGELGPKPRRGVLEWIFVASFVRPGWLPRGGQAAPASFPSAAPAAAEVVRRLQANPARYRALGASLDPAARDRLWIRNPFMLWMRWHYRLPEAVRMQAVHVLHHAAQIEELAAAKP